jgi:hypothetical protein
MQKAEHQGVKQGTSCEVNLPNFANPHLGIGQTIKILKRESFILKQVQRSININPITEFS